MDHVLQQYHGVVVVVVCVVLLAITLLCTTGRK